MNRRKVGGLDSVGEQELKAGAGGQDATTRLGPEVNIDLSRCMTIPTHKIDLTQQALGGK